MSDSHLPHCTICLKPLTDGFRCPEHSDLEKFPIFPQKEQEQVSNPEDFGLGDMLQFFANSGAKVVVFDENGIHEVLPETKQ